MSREPGYPSAAKDESASASQTSRSSKRLFFVRSACRRNCSKTTVEGNSHLKCNRLLLVRFVPFEQIARVGDVPDQEPPQIPGRISAASLAEADKAGDLSFVDEHPGRVEGPVK